MFCRYPVPVPIASLLVAQAVREAAVVAVVWVAALGHWYYFVNLW